MRLYWFNKKILTKISRTTAKNQDKCVRKTGFDSKIGTPFILLFENDVRPETHTSLTRNG